MREEFYKDFTGQEILGILQYQDNGDIVALTFPGRKPLGRYVVQDDYTFEFPSRKPVGKGNLVVGLFFKGKK